MQVQAITYKRCLSFYHSPEGRRLSQPGWLVTYQDVLATNRHHPSQFQLDPMQTNFTDHHYDHDNDQHHSMLLALKACFHYGCALHCVASDSQH